MRHDSATNGYVGSDAPLSWRMFGAQQRALREKKQLTQEELGKSAGYSTGHVREVEAAKRRPTLNYAETIDRALAAGGVLLTVAQELLESKHPEWFEAYAHTEAKARRLYSYSALTIDGLLQTEDHARSVLSMNVPTLDVDRVEELVSARLDRQKLLTRKPQPTLGFVLEQVTLERPIGGAALHKRQLEHLIACAEMRNVSIQVLETRVTTHVGLDGPMMLLETPDGTTLGYVEVQGVNRILTDPVWVGDLDQRYGIIRSQALSPERSLDLIKAMAGAL
ncbi:Scr1 family TA system antitoxin-like transcriptional regulator [Streptomyces noursei]|uniref:helix-turn-helix domain-containing protein n=1 Tax=Streptomyces noursei TaxID=1971 RepID=UPI0036D35FAF